MRPEAEALPRLVQIGAGIIPALFASCVAVFWGTLFLVIAAGGTSLDGASLRSLFALTLLYSPYCLLAFASHTVIVVLAPRLSGSPAYMVYAAVGTLIGISFGFVQFAINDITVSRIFDRLSLLLILCGATSGITVYFLSRILFPWSYWQSNE